MLLLIHPIVPVNRRQLLSSLRHLFECQRVQGGSVIVFGVGLLLLRLQNLEALPLILIYTRRQRFINSFDRIVYLTDRLSVLRLALLILAGLLLDDVVLVDGVVHD